MKGNTQLRQESIKKVLSEIRKNGPISKRELQAATGFSWGNISSVITLLMAEGYIMASGKQETYVGRKPEEFDINVNDNYIIGIDFNSEGVLVVICDLKGRAVNRYEVKHRQKNREKALKNLFTLVERALSDNKFKKISYIAVAMQGEVDTENGISVKISELKDWCNVPVCEELKNRFGIEAIMLHDPDCLLYTEKYFGVLGGKPADNAVLLRIDHGIGIAAMLGGKMYMGNGSKTCEIATAAVPVKGESGWKMLRDIVSESAVKREYLALTGKALECEEIAALAEKGDSVAKGIFKNLGNALGFALNNAIGLLNPETVILFGEFTRYSALFHSEIINVLNELLGEAPQTVLSQLDNNAAAVGAALFAADRVIEKLEFVD